MKREKIRKKKRKNKKEIKNEIKENQIEKKNELKKNGWVKRKINIEKLNLRQIFNWLLMNYK